MTAPENLRCTICSREVDSVEELRTFADGPAAGAVLRW